jgi:DNA-binding CsgD family transcriptional regulator
VLEQARALVDLGVALRRARRPSDARLPLREGLELAVRCGAAVLAQRARDELLAAGARPRRDRLSGPEALTASELRVARMAVEGKSNPEIAQALFLTRRTVETHLTHAYQKLGIGSREELATALSASAPRDTLTG